MAAFSDYLQNKALDHLLGRTTYTAPATVYYELYTVAPTSAGGGTPVSGGSYARAAQTNNTTNYPNASGGIKSNGAAVTFPAATADWGTVVAIAQFDASTSGNMLWYAPLNVPKTIATGDQPTFPIGSLEFQLT